MIKNKGIILKVIIFLMLSILSVLCIGEVTSTPIREIGKISSFEKAAFEIEDFTWYAHTTTNDIAYNGNHITVNGNTILFNGYGIPAYKDFLYNPHDVEGMKQFNFRISELVTDWHTLEGAGFLFNTKIDSGKLSGYCMLYEKSELSIYSLENIDVNAFHNSSAQTIKSNYGTKIISVAKPASSVHNLKLIATPTNITVIDNDKEVINKSLDYSKHYGNGYGPIVSYTQHNCSSLSKIQFEELVVIEKFPVKVYKYDENGKPLKGVTFEIKDEAGNTINKVTSDDNGIIQENLSKGKYTYKEISVPNQYILDSKDYIVNVDKDGVATGDLKIYNKIKKLQIITIDSIDSKPLPGSIIGVYKLVDGKKQEVLKGTTDSNGQIIWDSKNGLVEGTYIYQEIEAPKGYILDKTEYTVEINKFNQDGTFYGKIGNTTTGIEKIEYSSISNIQIKNTPLRVVITKTNEINEKLKDAKFEVYNESGSFKQTLVTDTNGEIVLSKLEPGEYSYKEVEAPKGYVLDQTIYKFSVDSEGKVTGTINVVNKEILPQVELPFTGIKTISFILIAILAINAIITFKKAK